MRKVLIIALGLASLGILYAGPAGAKTVCIKHSLFNRPYVPIGPGPDKQIWGGLGAEYCKEVKDLPRPTTPWKGDSASATRPHSLSAATHAK